MAKRPKKQHNPAHGKPIHAEHDHASHDHAGHDHATPGHSGHESTQAATAIDPVCGMTVQLGIGKPSLKFQGVEYHFCDPGCRQKFAANPQHYLTGEHRKPAEPAQAPASAGVEYTCPMHPEIRQIGPGSCPICGMALEPVTVTHETGPSHELIDMTRRFWIGLVLALPVFALEMGGAPDRRCTCCSASRRRT